MKEVLFVRMDIANAAVITARLGDYYRGGWHVVSHCERGDEYSFVLEKP